MKVQLTCLPHAGENVKFFHEFIWLIPEKMSVSA